MLVRDAMTPCAMTIEPSTTLPEAMQIMKERRIRRLPVCSGGVLRGIVTDRDLREAGPSTTSSLSPWEMAAEISHTSVEAFMRHPVITATPDTPLEQAAALMCRHKIGCLPILEGDALAGIITESDVFRCFAGMLGARKGTMQVLVRSTPEVRGSLEALLLRREIRTVVFSARHAEMLVVFDIPGGAQDAQGILEEFRRSVAGPVLSWQLSEAAEM